MPASENLHISGLMHRTKMAWLTGNHCCVNGSVSDSSAPVARQLGLRKRPSQHFLLRCSVFGKKSGWAGAIAHRGPTDVADGRMVEAPDDWSENVPSRDHGHLIDGSVSPDSFRAGRMPTMADSGRCVEKVRGIVLARNNRIISVDFRIELALSRLVLNQCCSENPENLFSTASVTSRH
jgi:hypothetical protein